MIIHKICHKTWTTKRICTGNVIWYQSLYSTLSPYFKTDELDKKWELKLQNKHNNKSKHGKAIT